MEFDAETPQYRVDDPTAFGYSTARSRWPVNMTQAIDDLHRAVSECEEGEKKEEGKNVVREISHMKYEIQHNRQITPLEDDGFPDVALYNTELQQRGPLNWLETPWLFAECFLFRRISSFLRLTKHWKDHDPWGNQKLGSFRTSRAAVLDLASKYRQVVTQMRENGGRPPPEADERLAFVEMCKVCLWGNATDLSLLASAGYDHAQMHKLQGAEGRAAAEANILVNDLDAAYHVLAAARRDGPPQRRVDMVLDNAGFELFVDLVLAGYLLASGLATSVILHPKSHPWFVSDVIPADFAALMAALADPRAFFEAPTEEDRMKETGPQKKLTEAEAGDLAFLSAEWGRLHADEDRMVLRPNLFWTHPGGFWRMPHSAPELFEDLKQSELVIFKGDLNYRKLMSDSTWDPTTPFTEAIGPLGPGSGINVLTLRTCKADVVVGLEPGEDERLRETENGDGDTSARKWAWYGRWAIVSLSKGK